MPHNSFPSFQLGERLGAPIDVTPNGDDPILAKDPQRNNNFDFSNVSRSIIHQCCVSVLNHEKNYQILPHSLQTKQTVPLPHTSVRRTRVLTSDSLMSLRTGSTALVLHLVQRLPLLSARTTKRHWIEVWRLCAIRPF